MMHRLQPWLCAFVAALALAGAPAEARDYSLGALRIVEPYARATPPGARTAGAWLRIENRGTANDELVGVASPVADSAELHVMRMEGTVARMRPVGAIGIPAGAVVALVPSGYHVMLVGLHQPLVAGGNFPLTLSFAKAGKIEVEVSVIALDAAAPAAAAGHIHR
ncbi:MAG TPA: copper chaperone PCu(A)C [Casimicrobiaceae bacterium]|nr:copper chaperone PCu(A)C [Casimicrobiaceae bacterium]